MLTRAHDTLSGAKPSAVADVVEMFVSQENFRKQHSQDLERL